LQISETQAKNAIEAKKFYFFTDKQTSDLIGGLCFIIYKRKLISIYRLQSTKN
jgi:hypothetical protein